MIKNILAIFFACFLPNLSLANSLNLNIGTSSYYTAINDPNYEFVKNLEIDYFKSITAQLNYKFDNNIVVGMSTNRIYNKAIEREVVNKANNLHFENKTKTVADSLCLGYSFGRFMPGLFIANTAIEKKLYYKNNLAGKDKETELLYGLNLSYYLNRHFNASIILIAPNKDLDLQGAIGVGIFYNLNLL